jgi:hypothetical protein
MIGSVTHKSKCDLESCLNYNIEYDVITTEGVVHMVWCAACDRDITHTAVPVS